MTLSTNAVATEFGNRTPQSEALTLDIPYQFKDRSPPPTTRHRLVISVFSAYPQQKQFISIFSVFL